jgi:3-hydroxyisobutyrate dehydrogenase-like beta-hydroxyacid dehydrogenase
VLRGFAENVFHVGGPGAGHTIKLLNNFIAQAICTATAEAFAVGQRAGVDLRKLVELVSVGRSTRACSRPWPRRWTGDMDGPEVRARQRAQGRALLHAPGREPGDPDVMGEAVHQSLALASALGHGKQVGAFAGRGAGAARARQAGPALKAPA